MEQVTMYKARNGKLFETEAECREYELYLDYSNTISEIYKKYADHDKNYDEIFEDEPEFVAEVAKAFDFEIKKTDLGAGFTLHGFVPKADCKDTELKQKAWENFDKAHILPW